MRGQRLENRKGVIRAGVGANSGKAGLCALGLAFSLSFSLRSPLPAELQRVLLPWLFSLFRISSLFLMPPSLNLYFSAALSSATMLLHHCVLFSVCSCVSEDKHIRGGTATPSSFWVTLVNMHQDESSCRVSAG